MSDFESRLNELETSSQDFGYRIGQIENQIASLEKDTNRMLELIRLQTETLASIQINQELITAKLP